MSDRTFRRDPSYRRHKQSGQAIVTLPDGFGGRRDFLLGKYGSKESRAEYRRRLAEWEAADRRLPVEVKGADITINELALAFWRHAELHYRRPDGTPSHELENFRNSIKPLTRLYGYTVAKDFGPLALKAVRKATISGSWMNDEERADRQKRGKLVTLSRGVVNQRVGRIRAMFKWGVSNELIPATVFHALASVAGLAKGRSDARETEPVKPVHKAHVEATLPFLLPTVADMVLLQLHSGARPGEVCRMRRLDLDMTGPVWHYRPGSDQGPEGDHKTAHRGHHRVIRLGPKAQEIIRRHLKVDITACLFSPADAMQEKRERDRQQRRTKVFPCEARRVAKKKRQRKYGDKYDTATYAIAIRRAIIKANAAAAKEAADRGELAPLPIPHWHPHQLRHSKATEIRKEFGLDAARAVLGHRSPVITEVYAELDEAKAVEVAAKLG